MSSYVIAIGAAVILYAAAALAADRAAHNLVYPLVGWGHPLEGRRRRLVRIFSPFILVGFGLVCAPIFLLVLVAMISYSRDPR